MKDLYLGQLAVMNMPHYARHQLQADDETDFNYVRCLLGFLSYLASLHFGDDGTIRIGLGGHYAAASSFLCGLPTVPVGPIFASRLRALEYIEELALLDMQYRSIRQDRQQSALQRIRASYYLAFSVCAPADRALWNAVPSGSIKQIQLSDDQAKAMTIFTRAMDVGNAEDHQRSLRRLFIVGKPGSGRQNYSSSNVLMLSHIAFVCLSYALLDSSSLPIASGSQSASLSVWTLYMLDCTSIAVRSHWSSMHLRRHFVYTILS